MNAKSKILIIDDESEICNTLRVILTREGYEVESTDDPHQGVNILSNTKYDAVVCDICMPNLDGISLLTQIRSQDNLTPFVILTGQLTSDNEHKMANLGAYEVVEKPSLKLVIKALKKVMDSTKEVDKLQMSEAGEEFLAMVHMTKKIG